MFITRVKTTGMAIGLSVAIGFSLVAAAPSEAQSRRDQVAALNARLDWMEQALIELQTEFQDQAASGGASGQPLQMFEGEAAEPAEDPAIARAYTRLDDLETQIREMTNQLEQLTFKIDQANRELASLAEDADYRLRALESGAGVSSPPARTVDPVQSTEEGSLGSVPASAAGGDYKDDYKGALSHLQRGEHDNAERALRMFLENHGDSELAGNAQYWLGESYYVREMWRPAAQSFLICVQKYKEGVKAPDCMLKLGMSLSAMGEKDKACKTLAEVPRRFPNASQTIKQRAKAEEQRNSCG